MHGKFLMYRVTRKQIIVIIFKAKLSLSKRGGKMEMWQLKRVLYAAGKCVFKIGIGTTKIIRWW